MGRSVSPRLRRFRLVMTGVASGLALAAWAVPAAAAPTNGMIGYTIDGSIPDPLGGPGSISHSTATINADGSGAAFAADSFTVGALARPTFSPDGNRELLFSFNGGAPLSVRDVDGTTVTPIPTPPGVVVRASWSPDGARIAFMLSTGGNLASADVWVMNADGSNPTQITSDVFAKGPLDWGMTPSGTKIAYVGGRTNDITQPCAGWQVIIMNPDGTGASCAAPVDALNSTPAREGELLSHGAVSGWLAWSPDGTKLALVSTYCGSPGCDAFPVTAADLWLVNLGAGTLTDLTTAHGFNALHPNSVAWSPAGDRLAVGGDIPQLNPLNGGPRFTGWGVYLMPAGGGGATRITPASLVDANVIGDVDWQACTPGVTRLCVSKTPPATGVPGGGVAGGGAAIGAPGGAGGGGAGGGAAHPGPSVVKGAAVTTPVSCPATARAACRGTVVLTTGVTVPGGATRRVTVGRASFRVPAGQRRVVRVRLTSRGRALLSKAGSLRVRLTFTTSARSTVRSVTIRNGSG